MAYRRFRNQSSTGLEEVVRLVPEGGVVCDLFADSGIFLVAAKEAGLRWVGCETNGAYATLADERLALGG